MEIIMTDYNRKQVVFPQSNQYQMGAVTYEVTVFFMMRDKA